jgi:GNAT superfamily N-acetyltransferase
MGESAQDTSVRPLGQPGDLGWIVMAHGELYAAELDWDIRFEALVARIVADYANGRDPARNAAWIGELAGRRSGCIICVTDAEDPDTAIVRTLLVHPDGRGLGLGRRLLDTLIEFAQSAGYARVRLWTNDPLLAARHLYLARGFKLIEEKPHHGWGVELVGQVYELGLSR